VEGTSKLYEEFDDFEAYNTLLFSNKLNICDKILEITKHDEEGKAQVQLEIDLLMFVL
jgi:hypothetical protein